MSNINTPVHDEAFPDPDNEGQDFIGAAPLEETPTQPKLQPESAREDSPHVEFSERPVTLKGVNLDPLQSFSVDSGLAVQSQKELMEIDSNETDESQEHAGFPGIVGLFQTHGKVLIGAIVCTVVGITLWPSKVPMPAPVAAPPVAVTAPAPMVTNPSPAVTTPTGGEGLVMPTGGIEMHGNMNSPDEQSRLASEMMRETQAIPLAEQVCSNGGITAFDQMRCTQVGQVKYFMCAADGRRWDVRKPGCENG